jgi:hypothetical protein
MFEGLLQPMHLLVIFFIALREGIRGLKEGLKEHSSEPAKPAATTTTENKS